MHRWTCWTLALVGLVALTAASSARALVVAPPPGPHRVAQADAIVVGRVIAHEDKDIQVLQPGGGKVTYRVAIVNVAERVKGPMDLKTVRVGFIPPAVAGDPGVAPAPIIRIGRGFPGVSLELGQDGMFFLSKLPKENLYTAPMYYDAVPRTNPNFERELEEAKSTVKLLDNPLESLKTGNPEERLNTASLLLSKYRQPRVPSAKTEAIPPEESKLILKAILDGNWAGGIARPGLAPVNSMSLFYQLGVTVKDGWKVVPGTNPQDAAKEWLAKNWETYRIQRIVPGEGTATGGPILRPGVLIPLPAPVRPIEKKFNLKLKIDR